MSQYTIGDNFNPKHNITKSMVGPLPLALHHDYLQYRYHVYLMHQGQNQGVTFPSPFNSTILNAFTKFEQNATLVSPQCSTELNKNGFANHMASSSSHVASLGP